VFSAFLLTLQLAEDRRLRDLKERTTKARRLRYLLSDEEVTLKALKPLNTLLPQLHPHTEHEGTIPRAGPFHIFLSHNWQHGQSAMRIVKVRLLELLPDASVFLDVDFLGGALPESHIDVSSVTLCFCTRRWFTSMPCVREAVRAVLRKVPLVALLDADTSDVQGGHGEGECRTILASPEYRARLSSLQEQVDTWAEEWGVPLDLPSARQITSELFKMPAIVWYRLSDLQDVSMRMIAERMLLDSPKLPGTASFGSSSVDNRNTYRQVAYVQDELAHRMRNQQILLTPLSMGCNFHIYCSGHNHGAIDVMNELVSWCPALKYTTRIDQICECEHMLVLLTDKTWMSGEASENFAHDVWAAMLTGVHRFLVHEVPGARQYDNDARHARPFEYFFEVTPKELITGGLYNEIAMNLAGDEWRAPGLIKTVQMLAKGGIKCDPVQVDESVTVAAGSQTDAKVQPLRLSTLTTQTRPCLGHGIGEDRHRSTPMDELEEPSRPSALSASTSDDGTSLKGDGTSLREDSEAGAAVQVADEIVKTSVRRVASFDRLRARVEQVASFDRLRGRNKALTRAKEANSSRRPQGRSYPHEQRDASSGIEASDLLTVSSTAFVSASEAVEDALAHSPRDRRDSITEGASRRMSDRL